MDAQAVQRQINETVRIANNEMLSSFSDLLDSRLSEMQRSISENQKAIAEKQEARIEKVMSDGYKFKKRGNEEQHKHNVKVLSKIQEANESIKEQKIEEAQLKIAEGVEIIKHRQKFIRLEDSSEAGWRAVDEYVKNPIASDSEDEKKISKAQTRAERKVKEAKAKKHRDLRELTRPYPTPLSSTQTTSKESTWRPGHCYRCNKRGHWRKDCTEKLDDNKISTFTSQNHLMVHSVKKGNFKTGTQWQSSEVSISPVGRLKENIGQWRSIGTNRYILDVIENGYKIPLFTTPKPVELRNNRSALKNGEFVDQEIEKLLNKSCIEMCTSKPRVVNPLTVAGSKTKQRLVLDARHINPHLFKYKHKYENASVSKNLFESGDYDFSFDLKSAYHHIMMHELDKEYLGFKWRSKYYVFKVLPFGLSTAGYIFSKVMREVLKFWRAKGYKIVIYLDDGMGGAANLHAAKYMS